MPLRARLVGLTVAALVAGAAVPVAQALPGRDGAAHQPGAGRVVLVSGRDDHGLPAAARVELATGPDGDRRSGTVRDGTLVRVVEVRGEWLRVRAVEGPSAAGWVNDYYLRGTLRLVGPAPDCRVRLAGDLRAPGTPVRVLAVGRSQLRVRAPAGGSGWVPRPYVRELAPGAEDGCAV